MVVKELTGSGSALQPFCIPRVLALVFVFPLIFVSSVALPTDDLQDLGVIAETAEQYALEQTNLRALEVSKLSARANTIDPRLRLGACELPLEPFSITPGAGTGRTTVGVRCTGSRPWTLYVPVQVDATISIYTASRALARGEVPAANDLALQEIAMAKLPAGYISSIDVLHNKELSRSIRAGEILTPNMFRDAEVVRKGQRVIIYAATPGIEVKMAGIAMENGVLGESIAVRNLSSGRTVQASIRNAETVIVGL